MKILFVNRKMSKKIHFDKENDFQGELNCNGDPIFFFFLQKVVMNERKHRV